MKEGLFGNPIHDKNEEHQLCHIRVCSSFIMLNPFKTFHYQNGLKPDQLLVQEGFGTTRFLGWSTLPHPWFEDHRGSIIKPPIPDTRITLAIKRFFYYQNQSYVQLRMFQTASSDNPKGAIDKPPNTGVGMECKGADSFPIQSSWQPAITRCAWK